MLNEIVERLLVELLLDADVREVDDIVKLEEVVVAVAGPEADSRTVAVGDGVQREGEQVGLAVDDDLGLKVAVGCILCRTEHDVEVGVALRREGLVVGIVSEGVGTDGDGLLSRHEVGQLAGDGVEVAAGIELGGLAARAAQRDAVHTMFGAAAGAVRAIVLHAESKAQARQHMTEMEGHGDIRTRTGYDVLVLRRFGNVRAIRAIDVDDGVADVDTVAGIDVGVLGGIHEVVVAAVNEGYLGGTDGIADVGRIGIEVGRSAEVVLGEVLMGEPRLGDRIVEPPRGASGIGALALDVVGAFEVGLEGERGPLATVLVLTDVEAEGIVGGEVFATDRIAGGSGDSAAVGRQCVDDEG